jgi:hypothetical protein
MGTGSLRSRGVLSLEKTGQGAHVSTRETLTEFLDLRHRRLGGGSSHGRMCVECCARGRRATCAGKPVPYLHGHVHVGMCADIPYLGSLRARARCGTCTLVCVQIYRTRILMGTCTLRHVHVAARARWYVCRYTVLGSSVAMFTCIDGVRMPLESMIKCKVYVNVCALLMY